MTSRQSRKSCVSTLRRATTDSYDRPSQFPRPHRLDGVTLQKKSIVCSSGTLGFTENGNFLKTEISSFLREIEAILSDIANDSHGEAQSGKGMA